MKTPKKAPMAIKPVLKGPKAKAPPVAPPPKTPPPPVKPAAKSDKLAPPVQDSTPAARRKRLEGQVL